MILIFSFYPSQKTRFFRLFCRPNQTSFSHRIILFHTKFVKTNIFSKVVLKYLDLHLNSLHVFNLHFILGDFRLILSVTWCMAFCKGTLISPMLKLVIRSKKLYNTIINKVCRKSTHFPHKNLIVAHSWRTISLEKTIQQLN